MDFCETDQSFNNLSLVISTQYSIPSSTLTHTRIGACLNTNKSICKNSTEGFSPCYISSLRTPPKPSGYNLRSSQMPSYSNHPYSDWWQGNFTFSPSPLEQPPCNDQRHFHHTASFKMYVKSIFFFFLSLSFPHCLLCLLPLLVFNFSVLIEFLFLMIQGLIWYITAWWHDGSILIFYPMMFYIWPSKK